MEDKPGLKRLILGLEIILTVVLLVGGFVFLQSLQEHKVFMTLFAVLWGLGSVALL